MHTEMGRGPLAFGIFLNKNICLLMLMILIMMSQGVYF